MGDKVQLNIELTIDCTVGQPATHSENDDEKNDAAFYLHNLIFLLTFGAIYTTTFETFCAKIALSKIVQISILNMTD